MLALKPQLTDGQPLRILCVGAHCDDIEIGAGGTLLRLLEEYEGAEVRWAIATSGAGRAAEARAAAEAFLGNAGRAEILIEDFPESFLPAHWEAVKRWFFQLRSGFEPDFVFGHRRGDRHQDHNALADFAWNTFRDHRILEYEIPKYEGDLTTPNLYVPLTAEQVDAKIAMLLEHYGSQRDKGWFDAETFRGLMRLRGVECNSPSGYAEGFHASKLTL